MTSAAGPYAPLHRSRLFITSLAYWRWVGETLNSISRSTRKRHRSFFFGGGCLFWLVLIWVVMLYYLLVISLVATALFGVVAVDAVLSTFGWIDEKRLQLVDRTPQYALPVRPVVLSRQPPPPLRPPPPSVLRPPPPPPTSSLTEEFKKLADLHQSGVLTDEEFAAGKAKLLKDGGSTDGT